MKVRDIDTKETVYLLTELPDGSPVIILHRPFAEEATRPHTVAVFSNTESGHELAEEICELKNDSSTPYLKTLTDAQDRTAEAVQKAAINILERTEKPVQEGGEK